MKFLELANAIKSGSFENKEYQIEDIFKKYRPLMVIKEINESLNKKFDLSKVESLQYNYNINEETLTFYHYGKQKFILPKSTVINDKNPNQLIKITKLIKEKTYIEKINCQKYKLQDQGYRINFPITEQKYFIEVTNNNFSEKQIINKEKVLFSELYKNILLNYYNKFYHNPDNDFNYDKNLILLEEWQKELSNKSSKCAVA